MDNFKEFSEAWTMARRMKAKNAMRKNKAKVKRGREIAKRRVASTDKLKARAQKKARAIVADKLSSGKDKSELSYAAREALEKRLDKKKGAIARIAKKIFPQVRKDELARKRGSKKPTNEAFVIAEKLDPNATAAEWVADFKASKHPKFAGKTDKEITNMAIAAWSHAQLKSGKKDTK